LHSYDIPVDAHISHSSQRGSSCTVFNSWIFQFSQFATRSVQRIDTPVRQPVDWLRLAAVELHRAHPTVKPVALVADAIKDCSHRGGIVLDSFAGSGTTLIAAEKTRRTGCGIELDPHYVDVILRRWEGFTGGTAQHAATGRTFAETACGRSEAHADLPADGRSSAPGADHE
jgi:DNA methylase